MLRTRKLRDVMLEEDVQCVQQCASMLRRVYRVLALPCLSEAKGMARWPWQDPSFRAAFTGGNVWS